VERVRSVGTDVLAALIAAHHVVHRDLKPGNVLLAADGRAKVADFGIAKTVGDVDVMTTGILLGTPAYLSPQQLDGQAATPASDIYSLGVLLYEALAGTKPFTSRSPVALAHAIHTRQPTPLGELRPDAPPELVATIARAMEKEPSRRFSTAEEMAEALTTPGSVSAAPEGSGTERFSQTQPLDARTQQLPWREEKQSLRSGGVGALVQARRRSILVFAVISVPPSSWPWLSRSEGTPRPGPPKPCRRP
jgi:serine/threonine protein kinase